MLRVAPVRALKISALAIYVALLLLLTVAIIAALLLVLVWWGSWLFPNGIGPADD